MFQNILKFLKNHALAVIVITVGLILVGIFHEILKPFIIAIIVAYIIHPLVKRLHKIKIKNRNLPKGVAVLTAYLLFLTIVSGVCFAFIPSLTHEVSQATEALPRYFDKVKDEDIPKWNANIDKVLYKFSFRNHSVVNKTIHQASHDVDQIFQDAFNEFDENSGLPPLILDDDPKPKKRIVETVPSSPDPVLFKLRQNKDGSYDILPGDSDVVLQKSNEGYKLHIDEDQASKRGLNSFNLASEIDRIIVEIIQSSTQYAGSALSWIQYAIEFLIDAFVQLILVFMLAAFISIDSQKILAGIRKLFEDKEGNAKNYDEFKDRLLKGLSGVVQGQLIICCINGSLTGIGLYILGVDFSLLLGIIAGVLSIVPIFGTIISTIPAVLLGLVQGPGTAILVLGWILLVHFCDTNFFTPKIVGSSSNLHPVVIIFALLAGQYAAGVLGLILAVPVTSICVTTIKFILEQAQNDPQDTTVDPPETPTDPQLPQDLSESPTEVSPQK